MQANSSHHSFIAMLSTMTSVKISKRNAIMHSCWVALFIALMTVMATPSAQTATAPGAPTGLGVTNTGTSSIDLIWTKPDDRGSAITGYQIKRTAGGVDVIFDLLLADVVVIETSTICYTDTNGLAPGITYEYQVRAKNSIGMSAESDLRTSTKALTAPSAPTGLTVVHDPDPTLGVNGEVRFSWTAPVNTGSGGVFLYTILRAEGNRDGIVPKRFMPILAHISMDPTAPNATTFSDNRFIDTNSEYYYRVVAQDTASVQGLASNIFGPILIEPASPDAPTVLMVTSTGTSSIDLTWTKPDDRGSAITGYQIQRRQKDVAVAAFMPVTTPNPLPFDNPALTGTSTISYTDTNGLAPGITYEYQVLAINTVGTSRSSNELDATTMAAPGAPTAPAAPGTPTAVNTTDVLARKLSIELSWIEPDNGGRAITGYQIERRVGGGVATLITPSGTATSYTDSGGAFMGGIGGGLRGGVTYEYQVFAINAPGPAGRSAPSNTVTATISVVAPGMPTRLMATTTALEVALSWTPPMHADKTPNDGGSMITSYRIDRQEGGAGDFLPVTTPDPLPVGDPALTLTGTSTISYTDTGLSSNTRYSYQVSALNTAAGEGLSATLADDILTRPVAPDRPVLNPVTITGTSSVTLSWPTPNHNNGPLSGYRIERTAGAVDVVFEVPLADVVEVVTGTGTSTSYIDTNGLAPGTTYSYQILAINTNASGSAESAFSGSVTATTMATAPGAPTAPAAPGTPTAVNTTDVLARKLSIELSWSEPDNGGRAITGYEIERRVGGGVATLITPSGTATSYTDSGGAFMGGIGGGLRGDVTYEYQVFAINAPGPAGRSAPSNTVTATTSVVAPGMPTRLMATGSATALAVELSWTPPMHADKTPDDGGSMITSYRIDRQEGGVGDFLPVTTPDPLPVGNPALTLTGTSTISYTDTGLSSNTRYSYQVSALNTAAGEGPSATLAHDILTRPAAPDVPVLNPVTITGTSSVTLSWPTPNHNNGPLSGYRIKRTAGAVDVVFEVSLADVVEVVTGTGTSTSYIDTNGLAPGIQYSYQILAINTNLSGFAESAFSGAVTATTMPTPPAAPTLNRPVPDPMLAQIVLSWTVPTIDGGREITAYRIERAAGATGTFMFLEDTGTSTTTYTDMDVALLPSTLYRYQVSAVNSEGAGIASNIQQATTAAAPVAPGAPTLMVVTGSTTTDNITLSWLQPKDIGDSAITGYEIQRALGDGTDPTTFADLTPSPVLDETARSHSDMTVDSDTEYSYRVRALNDAGAGAFATLADSVFTLPAPSGSPTGLMVVADGDTVDGSIIVDAITGDSITLSWVAPATNPGDPAISAYQIERVQGAGSTDFTDLVVETSNANTSYTDTGLSPGTTYRYRVSAINMGAGGAMSTSVPSAELEQITDVIAPSGLELRAIQNSATEVELSWTLEATGGEAVTYELERSEDPSFTATTAVTLTPNTVTSVTDSGLTAGTQYYYQVTATNSVGSEMSDIERPTGGLSERAQALNESLLPMVAQTASAMTLDAISNRIDNVSSGVGNVNTFAGADSSHAIIKQLGSDLSSEQELGDMLLKWLGNSSFSHSLAGSGIAGGAGLSVWGSGDYKDLDNDDNALRWDGNVWGLSVGADVQLNADWLLGTAVSWSSGEFDYTDRATESIGDYDYENFGIHPYFNWAPSGAGYNIWGSASYGSGEIEIRDQAMPGAVSSDTSQYGVAAGINLTLSSSHSQQASHSIDLKSDVSALWVDIDGSGEDILSDTVEHQRARLLLSGEYDYVIGEQRHLIPEVEVGARYDTGGSDNGAGAELSGSLTYKDLLNGLTLSGRMNTLLGADYDEWGASALMRFGGGASSRGLSFSLEPTIGRASSDPSRLWQQGLSDLSNSSSSLSGSLVSEISYGMGMHSAFSVPATWQPYANMELGSAIRRYRLGLRYQFVQGLGFRIEGQSLRNSGASTTDSNTGKDYGVQLKTEFEF